MVLTQDTHDWFNARRRAGCVRRMPAKTLNRARSVRLADGISVAEVGDKISATHQRWRRRGASPSTGHRWDNPTRRIVHPDEAMPLQKRRPRPRASGPPECAGVGPNGRARSCGNRISPLTCGNESEPVTDKPDDEAYDDGPEQRALDSEASRLMNEPLSTLPTKHREILILQLVVGTSAE